jgi:hypothetical protein
MRLEAAEAELGAYQRAQSVSGLGAEVFLAGMGPKVKAVEQCRRELAGARLSAGPVPHGGSLVELWADLTVAERSHALRGLLSDVLVLRGRGPCVGRVRVFGVTGDLPVELGVAGAHDREHGGLESGG